MMKRFCIIFLSAVAALLSCNKESIQEPDSQFADAREVTIEAGILTKTVLNGNSVMWEGSDEIALVFTHSSAAPHVNKTFVNKETTQSTARATFKGLIPNSVSVIRAPENRDGRVPPIIVTIGISVFLNA